VTPIDAGYLLLVARHANLRSPLPAERNHASSGARRFFAVVRDLRLTCAPRAVYFLSAMAGRAALCYAKNFFREVRKNEHNR
jgi:hypothetical protein